MVPALERRHHGLRDGFAIEIIMLDRHLVIGIAVIEANDQIFR